MPFARLAKSEDHPAIASFDEWHSATPEAIAAGRCLVAGREKTIEAYAIMAQWFGKMPLVDKVFVALAARRSGLGSALVAAAESANAGKRLWITTGLQNIPMQKLLNGRGYELCGVIEKLADEPELIYSRVIIG